MDKTLERACDKLAKSLIDEGRFIEAGFVIIDATLGKNLAPDKRADLRYAFFAGANHVWATMVRMMDPGEEVTVNDMRRMGLIESELKTLEPEMKTRFGLQ